jgi:signal-transduction protein with cAMP-binding, CBS, and nucleotidyltransferase domain
MSTMREVLDAKGHEVYSTSPNTTIDDAVTDMCRVRVGALLVFEGGRPIGVLSERDLMTRVILRRKDAATTRVREVMTSRIVCVDIDAKLEEAMSIMTHKRCRHLPVVVEDKVDGVVSIGDLVRWINQDQEYEIRALHDYVEGRYPA